MKQKAIITGRYPSLFGLIILGCCSILVTGCSTLKIEKNRDISLAFSNSLETSLGKISATASIPHSGESGFLILNTGKEAFLKRVSLLSDAERSIDLQYYIWNSDQSGRALAQQLLLAADKGVHVRLLLDDFNVGSRDKLLLLMNAHPNINIRIYNPNAFRKGWLRRALGFMGEFERLNQRMHNKIFTVDATVSIVGGRNIGDEYFDLHHDVNFRDRELLVIGPIVQDISDSFDAYWNNERAFAITKITTENPTQIEVSDFRTHLNAISPESSLTSEILNKTSWGPVTQLQAWLGEIIWAPAELIYDKPLNLNERDYLTPKNVAIKLKKLALSSRHEVLIESAYLIPGDEGIELLNQMVQSGVRVNALTNSLASNDLTTNHAGYARRRKDLLKSGVELFELKPNAASCQHLVVGVARCDENTLFSLHAKSMVFDGQTVFVGSFNFNQRSVYLNSEIALIIYSTELAEKIANDIKENFSLNNSWHVSLDKENRLQWIGIESAAVRHYRHEPQTGFWRRFSTGLLSIFPFEMY